MSTALHLVNPASDFATYFSAEVLAGSGLRGGAMVADLATTTLAALAPQDFRVSICDENIDVVDYDVAADWIGITGKINQRHRMVAIADEYRRRGKRVIIGGPLASLSPNLLRGHCDILVQGEVEDLAPELFTELRGGRARDSYVGGRPDLALSPVPRWDLYPNDRALMGALQTSRGCPFECEFCDVIAYLGRKQRHKPVTGVMAELEVLYASGYRTVFLADDNFTVHRRRCKDLLGAISEWQTGRRIDLVTQLSLDAARDPDLLEMCAAAGLTQCFIGIETPNEAGLAEAKKRQNLHVDLVTQTDRFVRQGIAVIGGLIVGFDADRKDIFQRQSDFVMSSAIPIFSLGALVAPDATPLHARIAKAGRLVPGSSEVQAVPWASNIEPLHMSRDELQAGLQWLCNAIYRPDAFGERMLRFIDLFGRDREAAVAGRRDVREVRPIDADALTVAFGVRRLGDAESRMCNRIWKATMRRPSVAPLVTRMLFQYAQLRHVYASGNYWIADQSATAAFAEA